MSDARQVAEAAARASYGRLVALLASRTRDIAAAEDALSEAFATALRVWPERGVPDKPEAWLLTTARRELSHTARAATVRASAQHLIELASAHAVQPDNTAFPDDRLKLLFVCAHPAIDAGIRTPLMLQTVLGLDASRIAAAFVVAPSAMGQRLVRAKTKIRDSGLEFRIPDCDERATRLADVLQAVYAAFSTGWDDVSGADDTVRGLSGEAIFLGRLLVALMPREPEPKGLLALMLYCEARRPARRCRDGGFVPLRTQDTRLWSRDMIIEAESLLTSASRAKIFGRFQCEAAIQSVHCQRSVTGRTHWPALIRLYDLLAHHETTLGVLVSRAAVIATSGDAALAKQLLNQLPIERIDSYQPYWVTRAYVYRQLADHNGARDAARRAISLTHDPAVRAYLSETYNVR